MKRVFTVGVFDYMHIGHIKLAERARTLGDHLTVAVQTSEVVERYKPGAKLLYSTDERMYMMGALKFVDSVVPYAAVDDIVKQVDFDIFCVGPDQVHEGFQRAMQWCRDNGRQVVVLPRTEGISSTQLRHTN